MGLGQSGRLVHQIAKATCESLRQRYSVETKSHHKTALEALVFLRLHHGLARQLQQQLLNLMVNAVVFTRRLAVFREEPLTDQDTIESLRNETHKKYHKHTSIYEYIAFRLMGGRNLQ